MKFWNSKKSARLIQSGGTDKVRLGYGYNSQENKYYIVLTDRVDGDSIRIYYGKDEFLSMVDVLRRCVKVTESDKGEVALSDV
jgi:hypothetical protein